MLHIQRSVFITGDWVCWLPRAAELLLWACADCVEVGLSGGPDVWASLPTWSGGELARLDMDGDVWAADTAEFGCPACDGDGCPACLSDQAVAEHHDLNVALRARHAALIATLGHAPVLTVRDLSGLLVDVGLITFDGDDRPTINHDVDVVSVIGLSADDDSATLLAARMNNKMWGPAVGALCSFARVDVAYSYTFASSVLAEMTGLSVYELGLFGAYIDADGGPLSLTHVEDTWVFRVDWKSWVRTGRPVGYRLAAALNCIGAVDDDDRACFQAETGVAFGDHPELDDFIDLT